MTTELVKRNDAKRKFYELIENNAASEIDDETGMVLVNADALADDLAALEAHEGMVLVPKHAIDWLMGEGPDAEGCHFGDAPDDERFKARGNFWWRSKFRNLMAAAPTTDKEG